MTYCSQANDRVRQKGPDGEVKTRGCRPVACEKELIETRGGKGTLSTASRVEFLGDPLASEN